MSSKLMKIKTGAVVLGLAAGGFALANAQGGSTSTPPPHVAVTSAAQQSTTAPEAVDRPEPGDTPDRPGEVNESQDSGEQVTGADAEKAKKAALSAVGNGKVTDISREGRDDASGKADTPESGDTPDPGYDSKVAYDVEVTKADGTAVDVHLDKAFVVLGTQQADQGD